MNFSQNNPGPPGLPAQGTGDPARRSLSGCAVRRIGAAGPGGDDNVIEVCDNAIDPSKARPESLKTAKGSGSILLTFEQLPR